jgi:hypothetical protein
MRILLLVIPLTLLAACSDDLPPPPPPPVAQAPATPATAPPEQADVAAAEVVESAEAQPNPCDLSGYDLSKMTVDMHENLVKRCDMWKEQNL